MASHPVSVTGFRRCMSTKSSSSISPYSDHMANELSLSHSQNSYQRQRTGHKYTMIMKPCEYNRVGKHKQQGHQQNYNRFYFMRCLIQSPAYILRKVKDFYNFGFHGHCTEVVGVVDKCYSNTNNNKMKKKNNRTMVMKVRDEVMAVEPYFSIPVVPAVASF